MKLSALSPDWLIHAGFRVGFIFRCPHCLRVWLTCLFIDKPAEDQSDLWPEDRKPDGIMPSPRAFSWRHSNGLGFEHMTVTPGLETPGHWSGVIKDGEMVRN